MLAQSVESNRQSGLRFYWLRDLRFDAVFLLLPLVTGIFFATICNWQLAAFATILTYDLWLLGYHHVISTYTRIAFDWKSAKEHNFLVFILPFLVLGTTFTLYYFLGSWIIATVYFYWQWFHYCRQSYGVSRYYLGRSKNPSSPLYSPIYTMALYALPVTGILYRSWQKPETFLGMNLWVLPTSYEVVVACSAVSVALIVYQFYSWWKLYRSGEMHGSYMLYMLSHHCIFLSGYVLIPDINLGWLAINMWHNMQYILFVWMQNNNKYRSGIDPEHPLISKISQNGKMWLYMATCLLITFFIYQVIIAASVILHSLSVIAFSMLMFMALNFHHYIVDSVIWRRKPVMVQVK